MTSRSDGRDPNAGRRGAARHFDDVEEIELRRLVNQAFDLRRGGYIVDACVAIVDWAERTLPDRLGRRARLRRDAA
jgi:hypothetical protein